MFEVLFISSVVALILLIWFNSNAFVEYAKFVGGAKFFEITEYEEKQKEQASLDYHGYLLNYKSSFFIKLITCPLCLSVWLSIFVTFLATDTLLLFPICNVLALIVYKLTANLLES